MGWILTGRDFPREWQRAYSRVTDRLAREFDGCVIAENQQLDYHRWLVKLTVEEVGVSILAKVRPLGLEEVFEEPTVSLEQLSRQRPRTNKRCRMFAEELVGELRVLTGREWGIVVASASEVVLRFSTPSGGRCKEFSLFMEGGFVAFGESHRCAGSCGEGFVRRGDFLAGVGSKRLSACRTLVSAKGDFLLFVKHDLVEYSQFVLRKGFSGAGLAPLLSGSGVFCGLRIVRA